MSESAPTLHSAVEREALAVADDVILRQMLDEERVESGQFDHALLGRLLRFAAPHKRLALVAIGLTIIEALLMTLPALIVGLAVDRVTRWGALGDDATRGLLERSLIGLADVALGVGASPRSTVVFFGLLIAGFWLARWGIAIVTTYLVQRLGQQVVHDMRVGVYRHITGLDQGYFHKNPVGRLVNRTTFDMQTLSELFSDAMAQGVRDAFFIVVLFAVMLSLDAPLALLLIVTMPLLVVCGATYHRWGRPALRMMTAVSSRMNAWLAENISGMRENHLYRREGRRRAEFEALTLAHQAAVTRAVQAWGVLRPAMLMVSAVATTLVLFVGYDRVTTGAVTVGVLITFLRYTTRLWQPVRNLTEKFNLVQNALTAGERVLDVLDRPSKMADGAEADPDLEVSEGGLAFDGVRFTYPGTDQEVLHGIDFEVEPGQMLALVGDTGAGKSTIVHLVSRFYDPSEGTVRVDGQPTKSYRLGHLRKGIAIVPQDVVVFAASLRENITLGAHVDDDRIWRAIRAVRADTFVNRFTDGLDHVLEEGGRTLSTGERQLLSFARALVANPPILILDEATASVDTRTELLIQEALEELTAGRTSIVIAHRLSTIRHADLILVLRHGRVVERGTHESLVEAGGEYAGLYRRHLA